MLVSILLSSSASSHPRLWRPQEELSALREKVEKLERDNTAFKHDNDRLESKVRVSVIYPRLLSWVLMWDWSGTTPPSSTTRMESKVLVFLMSPGLGVANSGL